MNKFLGVTHADVAGVMQMVQGTKLILTLTEREVRVKVSYLTSVVRQAKTTFLHGPTV